MSVKNGPGMSVFTRTVGPNAWASASVIVLSPALAAAYGMNAGCGRSEPWLLPGQRAFQMATQLALLTQAELIAAIIATDDQLSAEAREVARIGLANYFAGAFLLPYRHFHRAATELRYDIDLLGRRFEVGF